MSKINNLPHIDIALEHGDWPDRHTLENWLQTAVGAAAQTAGLSWPDDAELSCLFTNDENMALINGQWRNKPAATNVLSFPGADIAVGEPAEHMIGDLVFAFETVQREAEEQNKTFKNHMLHLAIHGFLHLFGYDHIGDAEADTMETLEISALLSLGIASPYA